MTIALAAAAGPGHAQPGPETALSRAASELDNHSDGFSLDGAPGSPQVLARYWSAARAWSAFWLARHPSSSPTSFQAAAAKADGAARFQMIALDERTRLVAASHNEMGVAFLLSRTGDGYAVAWSIDSASIPSTLANAGSIRDWKPGSERLQFGSVGALPRDARGRRRFYVEAQFAQGAGATVGQVLSVWNWDGRRASPLIAVPYLVMADQPPLRVRLGRIEIPAKGELKQLFACGACVGREIRITIALDPAGGARLVSERSLTPELDLIDELYDRVQKHKPADDIANRSVVAALSTSGSIGLGGLIDKWTVSRQGPSRIVCLSVDGSRLFIVSGPLGHQRVVAVQDTDSACDGPGARS